MTSACQIDGANSFWYKQRQIELLAISLFTDRPSCFIPYCYIKVYISTKKLLYEQQEVFFTNSVHLDRLKGQRKINYLGQE